MRVLAFLALLLGLGALVYTVPILWEIGIAGALGGWWWIFFRPASQAKANQDQSSLRR